MSTTSEQLLCLLEENASLLKKAQVNLKKCPKQRLTKGYIGGRLKCIEEYWQSFKTAHQELVRCTPKQQRMDIQYFSNGDYIVEENLQVLDESSNAMIVYLTVQRLDLETHKAWEDDICNYDSDVLPTWAELKNFLERHSAVKCRLQVSCRLCKRRHHTLLHQPKNDKPSDSLQAHYTDVEDNQESTFKLDDQPAEVLLTSHLATKRTTALLATALLPVKDERGHVTMLRALIDQGSQANFISERATQLLHLKGTPVKGTITGVGSTHQ
ncbi:unnamed protein product [Arctia plantaginis]|uniref:Peptidase A2 domain-containing protein n=1 Tax=Arctia plantaginis TaxID=874455 RepID=A0A8S1B3R8_ARCPL|nr:unnamed protein product [Arctia plantaginis]